MRERNSIYEYIAVYVDDLSIAAKDPSELTDTLMNKYSFKFKGTGHIKYHLEYDFFRDKLGVLCFFPRKYLTKRLKDIE